MTVHVFGASLANSQATLAAITASLAESSEKHTAPGKPIADWMRLIAGAGVSSSDAVVVIETGGTGIPTPQQVQEADRKLWATGARDVRWVVFTDWPDTPVRDKRRATRDIVGANARKVIQLPEPSISKLTSDGVHFIGAGYTEMGTAIANALRHDASSGRRGLSPVTKVLMVGSVAAVSWIFWKVAK